VVQRCAGLQPPGPMMREEIVEQMAEVVLAFARHKGVALMRSLASEDEVMAVACPLHGRQRCFAERGRTLRRGCLERQIVALRSDCQVPVLEAADGDSGTEACA